MVRTTKEMFAKAGYTYLVLFNYHGTPRFSCCSPSHHLVERRFSKTRVPNLEDALQLHGCRAASPTFATRIYEIDAYKPGISTGATEIALFVRFVSESICGFEISPVQVESYARSDA